MSVLITSILILFALFIVIDIPVLTLLYRPVYRDMFSQINGEKSASITRTISSGVVVYVWMAILLYAFVIRYRFDQTPGQTIASAFLLGMATYGIYDFTNVATIASFDVKTAVIDMIWGGILFSIVTFLFLKK